ncbi:hypothetical protein J1N35_041886 [Gossypium stocksii]|uniref:RNase H type-1 domain-containing protein n=1 Tax=Gossypium stocksii TaxID=47602 RepID=A0A9D3UGS4_9ROSI|nr:hypothetical protein J1N35_041886 [Gossypium stocksii]
MALSQHRWCCNCSILDAELWGILDGLKLIWRRGDAKVVIQSDSLEAVKAIHGSALIISHSTLIRRIHRILSQERRWLLRYIPREQNQSADLIAKMAFGDKEDLQLIETPQKQSRRSSELIKRRIVVIYFPIQ